MLKLAGYPSNKWKIWSKAVEHASLNPMKKYWSVGTFPEILLTRSHTQTHFVYVATFAPTWKLKQTTLSNTSQQSEHIKYSAGHWVVHVNE